MTIDTSPWADIAIPGANYNVRQIGTLSVIRCFWGRDTAGCYLFIVELTGDHSTQFRKNNAVVNGVDIDLRESELGGGQRLVLTLERQVDRDLFAGLCRTLIAALEAASDSISALAIALAHIQRWKTFMSGKGGHLSSDEIRG